MVILLMEQVLVEMREKFLVGVMIIQFDYGIRKVVKSYLFLNMMIMLLEQVSVEMREKFLVGVMIIQFDYGIRKVVRNYLL